MAIAALFFAFPLAATPAAAAAGDTGTFLSILPPGQSGYLTLDDALAFLATGVLPPHVDDQREMYSALALAPPGLSEADLPAYFKPAPLAPPGAPESVSTPRPGVTIARDAFGVPYITARRRSDVMFGLGYASAEDRLFFMDVSRHAARGRLSEFLGSVPGLSDFAFERDEATYEFAGYSEAELQEQFDRLRVRFRGKGRRVQRDFADFVAGINAFVAEVNADPSRLPAEYVLLGLGQVEPWTVTDVVAIATQLEAVFGTGGGEEHRNAELLEALQARFGQADGAALFRDLREAEDPEAPVSTEREFPYLVPGTVDPAAVALPDPGSVELQPAITVDGAGAGAAQVRAAPAGLARVVAAAAATSARLGGAMSNFVVVTREQGAGGHPVAVMGPQVGYFIPAILMEASIQGGGIAVRGALTPGFPYVVLGRGRNFAWSATAGGSDTIDVRVERLCEPGGGTPTKQSRYYLFNGVCTAMTERVDRWCAGTCPPGQTNVTATVQRTVHGNVFARATVGGIPVALVRQRASFMRELDAAVAFMQVNRRSVSPTRFVRAMGLEPASFNWAFVNHRHVVYFHSGLYPRRAPGVDPELPSWGTGQWEWQGFLRRREHPFERNPRRGYLASWNNKPARGWRAADDQYSFGPVHRVESLDERLEAAVDSGQPVGPAELVELMAEAAQVDLRGSQVLPWALELVAIATADDPQLAAKLAPAVATLAAWQAAGAPRGDRDGDGEYDYTSAVAIMDAWYEPMIHAAFDGQLAGLFSLVPMGFDDRPGPLGSAYQSGYYGYLQKAFRMALGAPVAAPFEVLRCADGTTQGCATAIAASLSATVDALTAQFGSPDPQDWRADPTAEQIEFQPFGIATVDPIPWTNRPTFQQVVQVERRRAGR